MLTNRVIEAAFLGCAAKQRIHSQSDSGGETGVRNHSMRKFLSAVVRVLAVCTAFVMIPSFSWSQTTPDFNSGLTPYQGYHGGDIDSINMATGSLNLHIPLISFPQRGSALRLNFAIEYNSSVIKRLRVGTGADGYYLWSVVDTNPASVNVIDDQAYWLYEAGVCAPNPPCGKANQIERYYHSVLGADGAQHLMGYITGYPAQTSGTQTLRSMDGTGFYLTIQNAGAQSSSGFSIYDKAGVQSQGPLTAIGLPAQWIGTRHDANGNSITATTNGYTDTMGRSVPQPPLAGQSLSLLPTGNTDMTGCTGPSTVSSAVLWSVPGYNGTSYPIKFCFVTLKVWVADDAGGKDGLSDGGGGSVYAIQSIVLPDPQTLSFSSSNTTSWEFEYADADSYGTYGSLTKVTFPTGGSISYTYATVGTDLLQRAVTSRTVSDGTTSRTWTYAYPLYGGTTTVTDPIQPYDSQANVSVHTIVSSYETGVAYYQGSSTLLKTISKGFNYLANPYNGGVDTGGFGPVGAALPSQTTTTWANGKTSQVQYTYDSGFSVNGIGTATSSTTAATIPYGLQTAASYYDYSSGAAGGLLKTEQTTYQWQVNGNYLSTNLLNLKSQSVTLDGSGNKMAETDYTYDASSQLVASGVYPA
jgi:hypothetical protein